MFDFCGMIVEFWWLIVMNCSNCYEHLWLLFSLNCLMVACLLIFCICLACHAMSWISFCKFQVGHMEYGQAVFYLWQPTIIRIYKVMTSHNNYEEQLPKTSKGGGGEPSNNRMNSHGGAHNRPHLVVFNVLKEPTFGLHHSWTPNV